MNNDLKFIYLAWIFVIISSIIILPLILASPDLTDNLVSYYKLDGTSGDVKDELDANNATNNGATRGETGIINNAFDFNNPSSQYITIGSSTSLSIAGNMTISEGVKVLFQYPTSSIKPSKYVEGVTLAPILIIFVVEPPL